jgi:outer membrane protein assembly factor BamD (BamD/ComL family)
LGASKIISQKTIIAGVAIFTLIVLFIIYIYTRDTPKNNFRKAKKYHRRAEKYYEHGETELADENYELAREYREYAQEQIKGDHI